MLKSKATLPYQFNQKHIDYMGKTKTSTFNIAEGAVRAGKTVDNILTFALLLDQSEDKLHLASGSTVGNAKVNIGASNGFGLENIFRGRCRWGKYLDNEALYVKTVKGEKIIMFAGGGKADSYKSVRGNSIGYWIATEINLHHPDFIDEAIKRQFAAKDRKMFWDLNPDNPNHWIYKEYIDLWQQQDDQGDLLGGYNYENFVIYDNESLSEQRIKEIESQYPDKTSMRYLRYIAGKRVMGEGAIYDMFSREKHVVPTIARNYTQYYVSVDYGTQNPTVFGLWGCLDDIWYKVKEYHHSGREEGVQKTDTEYADDLERFIDGIRVKSIIVDPSAASFKAELRQRRLPVRDAVNDVLDGIRNVGTALVQGKVKYNDCCEETKREFESYIWDEKAAEKGIDKPLELHDHHMDADRYFINTILFREKTPFHVMSSSRKV